MNPKIVMYVYGDITTDARVNRAATALANNYEVTLISQNCGKVVKDGKYKNILVKEGGSGAVKLFKNIRKSYNIIKERKPEIVYCHDYYSAILAFLLLSRKFCKHIVYDAHELIIPEPGIKDRRMYFFYWFEKRIVKRVDKVFCASSERGAIMQKHYGLFSSPVPIRNISQLSISDDDLTLELLYSLKHFFSLPGPIVVYAGVVTKSRKIEELVKAVSSLAPKFKLLVVGDGDATDLLKRISSSNPKLSYAFTGSVPYKSLGAILAKCDVGFIYYPVDTLNNKYCAPNKIYEYASVGLPIISNQNPTMSDVLIANQIGISSNDFIGALNDILVNIDKYKESCKVFSEENRWENDEALLCREVSKLEVDI